MQNLKTSSINGGSSPANGMGYTSNTGRSWNYNFSDVCRGRIGTTTRGKRKAVIYIIKVL